MSNVGTPSASGGAGESFERWLAVLLGQTEQETEAFLGNKIVLHFLVTWSLFESKCFGAYMRLDDLHAYATRVAAEGLDTGTLLTACNHFHARYQDTGRYKRLRHTQDPPRVRAVLAKSFPDLNAEDQLLLVAFVVYRFRNNIFHGNKSAASWLQYETEISMCIAAMRSLLQHERLVNPTAFT